jgi:hypothetical protein
VKFPALGQLSFIHLLLPVRANSAIWVSFFSWILASVMASPSSCKLSTLRVSLRLGDIWNTREISVPIALRETFASFPFHVILILEGRHGHSKDEASADLIVKQLGEVFPENAEFGKVDVIKRWK